MDFRKIARQLNEEPIQVGDDGVRRVVGIGNQQQQQKQPQQDLNRFNKTGERGIRFEGHVSRLLDNLSTKDNNPIEGKNHQVLKGSMKTDIKDDAGVGYSVKTKMNNDLPMKMQQSSYDSTLWSKLNVPWAQRAQDTDDDAFKRDIKDNKLAQALVMSFGSGFGS